MTLNQAMQESKRERGIKTDTYMFTSKNSKFANKDYGKLDPKQYNTPPDTDDVKAYKKSLKSGKSYLVKVNKGYKVKI